MNPTSILIPTSPHPAIPDTAMVEGTIEKLRAYPELADSDIFLMIDGVREAQQHYLPAYTEYTRRLLDNCNFKWKQVTPLVFEVISHQAIMTRQALERVRTPLILFIEHDCFPVGEIPWNDLFRACLSEEANKINLYISDAIPDEHLYLYPDGRTRHLVEGVPLIKTRQYSQRPHLAKKSFYDFVLREYFDPARRTMIEDVLHGICQSNDWSMYKTWVYAPEGSLLRHRTVDGRKTDPKYIGD